MHAARYRVSNSCRHRASSNPCPQIIKCWRRPTCLQVRAAGLPRAVLGDVVGEHVALLSAQAPEASQVIAWLRGRGARPAQILADWHVALDAPGLAAFVAAFPDLRYEVRPPTLDDLFLALASEHKP